MLRPRIIVSLLIRDGALVKTRNFKEPKYIGDPINAVRIFNEKQCDELIVLDIDASVQNRGPNFELIKKLARECRMPLCYGGGIKTVDQAVKIIDLGVEKVALSSAIIRNINIVEELAGVLGNQSIVAVLDIKKRKGFLMDSYTVHSHNAAVEHSIDPLKLALQIQNLGIGEIVLNNVDRDGMMNGYDKALVKIFKEKIKVPVTALGGAGSFENMKELLSHCGMVGLAAGSLFVLKGKYRAVLISYPSYEQKIEINVN